MNDSKPTPSAEEKILENIREKIDLICLFAGRHEFREGQEYVRVSRAMEIFTNSLEEHRKEIIEKIRKKLKEGGFSKFQPYGDDKWYVQVDDLLELLKSLSCSKIKTS